MVLVQWIRRKGETGMELKGRLGALAEKIPLCTTLADVGTDHAYIPIDAVKRGKCKRAIATDVRKGPIFIAQRNIERHGAREYIETRLGNGLEPLAVGEAEVIVIAGMGGTLIQEILEKGFLQAQKAGSIVLQPMNAIEVVREWLDQNGFTLLDESLTSEGEKIYHILHAQWSGKSGTRDELGYYLGRRLMERNDPLLDRYLVKKLKQLERMISGMEKADARPDNLDDYIQIREYLKGRLKEKSKKVE